MPPYTAAVLAGGLGTRMAGADKGLLRWQGIPLISHVRTALGQPAQWLVSCNRHTQDYADLGWTPVPDPVLEGVEAYAGPLLGLLGILEAAAHDGVLISPCDTPQLPEDFAARLCGQGAIACAHDGERWHPLHMWISRALAPQLREALQAGERRVMAWVQAQQPVVVDFSDCPDAFANCNTPEVLGALTAPDTSP